MLPDKMKAVLLTGHGGMEKLVFRDDIPVPKPSAGEVLIQVKAAGVNNTDINTRIGWYSKVVTSDTQTGGSSGFEKVDDDDASWSGEPLVFPCIQGADVCGHIVAVGEGVNATRIGERIIVRNMLRSYVDYRPYECWTLGSECDGGFAQYSTAEGMLHRASVGAETVLITGASGGVGSAAVQLAKRRGATVIALCSPSKSEAVRALARTMCWIAMLIWSLNWVSIQLM